MLAKITVCIHRSADTSEESLRLPSHARPHGTSKWEPRQYLVDCCTMEEAQNLLVMYNNDVGTYAHVLGETELPKR